MSQLVAPPVQTEAPQAAPPERPSGRAYREATKIAVTVLLAGAAAYGLWHIYERFAKPAAAQVPVAKVERGSVVISITAKGQLQGGDPEVLVAPMTAGGTLHITYLRKPGEPIKSGETVVAFDTTEQEYKLKEAESDLAEAEQKILQAKANREAQEEEDRYSLIKARNDLKLAELEARKNPLLAAITAKQNDLAVESGRDHLAQVQQNITNRAATSGASLAIEQAGRAKAEAQATTARQNIEAMTLRAHHDGYVSIKQAMPTNGFFTDGMVFPLYQVGDSVNPGMQVAEIPDLNNWQIEANIGELDRGHVTVGNTVSISVVAVPGRQFHGVVKDMGGTTGPFWDRHFETKIALSDPTPVLRPGMSTELTITTETLKNVLSVPAQCLFDANGRTFVYLRSGSNFTERDVKLVRKNDTRAVITGLRVGDVVALSNPLEAEKTKAAGSGPLSTVGK
ncbi:MAG: efflux RND transporter periplasmic adaptor subunit [Acidobacteriaceae bacterium]|nr:efflux RND transporter periplasmic adaptor subunit [Acidobacteriaceae bacterium]